MSVRGVGVGEGAAIFVQFRRERVRRLGATRMGSCCSSDKGQDPTMPLLGKEGSSSGSPKPMSDAAPSPSTDPGYENLARVPASYNPPSQIDRTKSLREQKMHATSQQADLAGKLRSTQPARGIPSPTPCPCFAASPLTRVAVRAHPHHCTHRSVAHRHLRAR